MKIIGPARGALMSAIKSCDLGRPVHILDRFCDLVHDDLSTALDRMFNARGGPGFRLGPIEHSRKVSPHQPLRWYLFDISAGRAGFAIERRPALALLARRLGMNNWTQIEQGALQRAETATEKRLAAQVGKQLVQTLSRRLLTGMQECPGDESPAVLESERVGYGTPADLQALFLGCDLLDTEGHSVGRLHWVLEDGAMNALMRALAPARRKSTRKPPAPGELRKQLPVLLDVRLVEQQLSLGEVMALRPGSVLPVDINLATVRIQDTPVFKASVVEHRGALCLTSLQEV